MSSTKLATEKQVRDVVDTFSELYNHQGKQIKGLESGIIDSISPDSISPEVKGMYSVTSPGIFINFKDINGNPIEITSEEYGSALVFIVFNGISCEKRIIYIEANGKVEEGDSRAVSGGEVYDHIYTNLNKGNKYIIHNIDGGISNTTGDVMPDITSAMCSDFIKLDRNTGYTLKGFNGGSVSLIYIYNEKKQPIGNLDLTEAEIGDATVFFDLIQIVKTYPEAFYFRSTCNVNRIGYLTITPISTLKESLYSSVSLFSNVFGINKPNGLPMIISQGNIRTTDYLQIIDIIHVKVFNGQSTSACYVYDEELRPLGDFQVSDIFSEVLEVSILKKDIETIYPNARYYRFQGRTLEGFYLAFCNPNSINTNVGGYFLNSFTNIGLLDDNGRVNAEESGYRSTGFLKIKDYLCLKNASKIYLYDMFLKPLGELTTTLDKFVKPIDNSFNNAVYFKASTIFKNRLVTLLNFKSQSTSELGLSSVNVENLNHANKYENAITKGLNKVSAESSWYGIKYNENDSDPTNVERIASDMNLHDSLPIQSKIKRCIVWSGIFQGFLNDDDSTLFEDGTVATLDGSRGDVMVFIPSFYYICEQNGDDVEIKISENHIEGWEYSPSRYTSAFEATIHNSIKSLSSCVTTNFNFQKKEVKIKSISNYEKGSYSLGIQNTATISGYTPNAGIYRGGDNNSNYDNALSPSNNEWSLNCLGRPRSNMNRNDARELAINKGNGALMYGYDTHKALWLLSFVEIANRNFQTPISQGGLGLGATQFPTYNGALNYYDDMRAIIPCGVTLSLGNKSGEVYWNMENIPINDDATQFGSGWMPVMSYRGVENFYGHQYKLIDQITIRQSNYSGSTGANTLSSLAYYYYPNPYLTNDDSNSPSFLVGKVDIQPNIRVIKKILLGKEAHFLPIESGDVNAYDTYYADCIEIKASGSSNIKYMSVAGRYVSKDLCGPLFCCSETKEVTNNIEYRRSCNVTRLDYIIT